MTQKKEEMLIEIIVNARARSLEKDKISFQEVVILAYGEFVNDPNVVYTVTYSKGQGDSHSLVYGEETPVKKGIVFNVTKTDKS